MDKKVRWLYRVHLYYVGPKRWYWLTFTFSSLSSMLIWNAKLFPKVPFSKYFLVDFRNPKILHVACHNLSQIDVTKTLRPFQAVIMTFTYDLKYWWENILWLTDTFAYLFGFPGEYYKVTIIIYWIEVLPFVGL